MGWSPNVARSRDLDGDGELVLFDGCFACDLQGFEDFEALREVSPMLASRSGLSTGDQSLSDVAANIAELFQV